MSHHRDNFLLNLLEPDVFDQIEPQLSIIDLQREQVLAETHQRIESVYFPHSGIISCVVELIGGGAIETGMIGKDGTFGSSQALDDKVSLNHVVTQLGGTASLMSSDHLRQQAEAFPAFRSVLTKYDQFFLAQVQQHVACNAVHNVQARTCKWLLRMHELAGPDLLLTQEFLAQMMGVTRTIVSTGRRTTEGWNDYAIAGVAFISSTLRKYKNGPANATKIFALTIGVSSVQMKNSCSRRYHIQPSAALGDRRSNCYSFALL